MKIGKVLVSMMIISLLFGCSTDGNKGNLTKEELKQEKIHKENNSNNEKKEDPSVNQTNTKVTIDKQYFNEVEVIDGKEVIKNVDNLLILVNKKTTLPGDYIPRDLVRPNVAFSFGDQDIEKSYMRKDAAEALEKMFDQAKNEGIYLFAVSGYRSYERQNQIFQAEVNAKGYEKAAEAVAIPGQSEHQTGLTMDISAESVNFTLTQSFESTAEGKWLKDNAHRFGFILRYPKGKEQITGYKYEPWHFRYVGEEMAEIIYENDWTLEEFFDEAAAI